MADWTPEDSDFDEWLERWLADGWRCEYPWSPTPVVVNGRLVHRVALIRDSAVDTKRAPPPIPGRSTRERPLDYRPLAAFRALTISMAVDDPLWRRQPRPTW